MMSDRVRQILGYYESDCPGVLANIRRILGTGALADTGKLVILPVDQGFEHGPARSFGPNSAGYDPHYHFELALEAGCGATPPRSAHSKPAPAPSPANCR